MTHEFRQEQGGAGGIEELFATPPTGHFPNWKNLDRFVSLFITCRLALRALPLSRKSTILVLAYGDGARWWVYLFFGTLNYLWGSCELSAPLRHPIQSSMAPLLFLHFLFIKINTALSFQSKIIRMMHNDSNVTSISVTGAQLWGKKWYSLIYSIRSIILDV
jgi:hypothetical protein